MLVIIYDVLNSRRDIMRKTILLLITLLMLTAPVYLVSDLPKAKFTFFRNYGAREFQYKRFESGTKIAVIPSESFILKGDFLDNIISVFTKKNADKPIEIYSKLKKSIPSFVKDFNFEFFDNNHSIFDSDSTNINVIRTIAKENTHAKKIDSCIKEPTISYRKMEINEAMLENIHSFKTKHGCDYLMLHLTTVEEIKAHVINRYGDNQFKVKLPVIETQIWDCRTGQQIYSGKTFCTSTEGIESVEEYVRTLVNQTADYLNKMLKVKRKSKKATGMFG